MRLLLWPLSSIFFEVLFVQFYNAVLLNDSRTTKIAFAFHSVAAWLHSSHTQTLQLRKLWGAEKK